MVTRRDALSIVPLWLGALIATLFVASAHGNPADGIEFFEAKIRPLLIDRCMECHDDEKQKGGLRLDSRSA